jgi:hypothetical protein
VTSWVRSNDFDLTETVVREWLRPAERAAGTGDGGVTSALVVSDRLGAHWSNQSRPAGTGEGPNVGIVRRSDQPGPTGIPTRQSMPGKWPSGPYGDGVK